MDFSSDMKKNWWNEFEKFISHWEGESQSITEKSLDPNECNKITDIFHRDSNGLMVRRPVDIPDEKIQTRLEKLDSRLNSVLAMACTSELKTVKKF